MQRFSWLIGQMDPTHDEVLGHLLEILRHNDYAYWGKDGVSSDA